MPQQFPDSPSPEIAAERERVLALMAIYARNPGHLQSRVFTAVSHGYSLAECEQRWGKEFQL